MELPKRKPTWLSGYNQSQAGGYFVTVCTKDRKPVLCDIVGETLPLQNIMRHFTHQYGRVLWQRSYYDHVIRNEEDYRLIWQYIDENPLNWQLDELYIR